MYDFFILCILNQFLYIFFSLQFLHNSLIFYSVNFNSFIYFNNFKFAFFALTLSRVNDTIVSFFSAKFYLLLKISMIKWIFSSFFQLGGRGPIAILVLT